jgi:bifunctional UDP-N-acetylglucosamine pyrophosphorylase/glucosamine-1-phosphate N-acetyltransferase
MPHQDFAIAIMAAGKGTRLKSKRPKVLHEVGGKALLAHVIRAAAQVVSPQSIYVIIGHEADRVRAAVGDTGVNFIVQPEQHGTGHAIQCAREQLSRHPNFLVLSGDAPMIRAETIRRIRDFHTEQHAAMTILTAHPVDPTGYGRVLREGSTDRVMAIIEQKSLRPEQSKLGEINSGFYAFASQPVFANINRLAADNPHKEFYLTDMAALLVAEGEKVMAIRAEDADEVLGGNTIAELSSLDANMRMRKARELMAQGVTRRHHLSSGDVRDRRRRADWTRYNHRAICPTSRRDGHRRRLPHSLLQHHQQVANRERRDGPVRLHHR